MMPDDQYVLVLKTASGRRFGIRRDVSRVEGDPYVGETPPDAGVPVLEDADTGTELGTPGASCEPFLVTMGGEQHVIFAGTADFAEQKFAIINGRVIPIRSGVWMAAPEPFTEGMRITFAGLDKDQRELFRFESPPLRSDKLRGYFGPGWTSYAPSEEWD